MGVQDTPQGHVPHGKLDRGVGLEGHAPLQAVDIKPRYGGVFVGHGRFLFHDRRQDGYFDGRQSYLGGLRRALPVPEPVVFLLHPLEEPPRRDVPIEFVGVGDEHELDGRPIEPHGVAPLLVVQVGRQVAPVQHQLLVRLLHQVLLGADGMEGEAHRGLLAVAQHPDDFQVAHFRTDAVASRAQMAGVVHPLRQHLEAVEVHAGGGILQGLAQPVPVLPLVYVDIDRLVREEVGGADDAVAPEPAREQDEEQCHPAQPQPMLEKETFVHVSFRLNTCSGPLCKGRPPARRCSRPASGSAWTA